MDGRCLPHGRQARNEGRQFNATRLAGLVGSRHTGAYTATIGGDCNDSDAAINPGATEICDAVDNNCDMAINEGAVCGDCAVTLLNGKSYGYCGIDGTMKLGGAAAADACAALGAGWALASINDQAEQDALWAQAIMTIGDMDNNDGDAFWTSGSVTADVWSWADGTDFPPTAGSTNYSNWAPGEPNGGSNGNCVVLGRYAPCTNAARYICEFN